MSDPQWSAFMSAVIAALQADSAIGGAGIPVYDGPPISGEDAITSVIVGGNFGDDANDAGTFNIDLRTDGGSSAMLDETIRLNCAVQYWGGDADMASARAGAFDLLADVNRVLRATPSLGVAALLWCFISFGDVQLEMRQGAQVTIRFTINARAII